MADLKCDHCGAKIDLNSKPRDVKAICFGWAIQSYTECKQCGWINSIEWGYPVVVASWEPEKERG